MRIALPLLLGVWQFAVSGDSRNCGDIVMPAIAAKVQAAHAAFYWHLGDFRRGTKPDEDMEFGAKKSISSEEYAAAEWPDFIQHQLQAFGTVPVFVAMGNHETHGHSRADFARQFAHWIHDSPNPYHHWIEGGVDFIALDNASKEMFDAAQIDWLTARLAADLDDTTVKTVVLGMHEALPHSLGCDHSMDESLHEELTGEVVYRQLLQFRAKSKKNVYVIASHSHYWMSNPYDSPYWRAHGGVLPGVIVGGAGAVRYRLPETARDFPPARAKTDTYGFALATVHPDGTIDFEFREITRSDIPADVAVRYGGDGMDFCLTQNKDAKVRTSAPCSAVDAVPSAQP